MQIEVIPQSDATFAPEAGCLVLPVFEEGFPVESPVLAEADDVHIQTLADRGVLRGAVGTCYYISNAAGNYGGILVLGLGTREKLNAQCLRRAGGTAAKIFSENRIEQIYFDNTQRGLPVSGFLEGIVLGQYDFTVYKTPPKGPEPQVVTQAKVIVPDGTDADELKGACDLAVIIALGSNGARHLGNTPPNELGPAELADFAKGIAEESKCTCTILERAQMASLGMNALLGVARGSAKSPRLIVLEHRHPDATRHLMMVGKGVTFDTGGISLKPGQDMHEMKFDMCGAAAVLGAMMTVAQLEPAINVTCIVPAVENMPDADAMRPGDILRAYNGKTIEVHNTDAEGRLILADALAYGVDKYKPDAVVDLATLTGACVVALGHYAAGLFTQDDALSGELGAAGDESGERVWRLPLWPEYAKLIEGTHADICNIGPRGEAGSITAAAFLEHFVGDTPWAHLDIAGTAWGGRNVPHLDAHHATGFGVRLLLRWILAAAKR